MPDQDLLKQIGLNETELAALLKKFDDFVKTLTQNEKAALTCLDESGQAKAMLSEDVKPGELAAFIRTRAASGIIVTFERLVKRPRT